MKIRGKEKKATHSRENLCEIWKRQLTSAFAHIAVKKNDTILEREKTRRQQENNTIGLRGRRHGGGGDKRKKKNRPKQRQQGHQRMII